MPSMRNQRAQVQNVALLGSRASILESLGQSLLPLSRSLFAVLKRNVLSRSLMCSAIFFFFLYALINGILPTASLKLWQMRK